MAVTNLTAHEDGLGGMVVSWEGDTEGALYYVYLDGILATETAETSWAFTPEAGSSPVVDVLDDGGLGEGPIGEPVGDGNLSSTLAWWGVAGADYYLVEERTSGDWGSKAQIEEDGRGFYTWQSEPLEDGATYHWRITAMGTNGNLGVAARVCRRVIRRPDAPRVEYAYASGDITVSEDTDG